MRRIGGGKDIPLIARHDRNPKCPGLWISDGGKVLEDQRQQAEDLTKQLEDLSHRRDVLLKELDDIKDQRDERLRAAFEVDQLTRRLVELKQALEALPDEIMDLSAHQRRRNGWPTTTSNSSWLPSSSSSRTREALLAPTLTPRSETATQNFPGPGSWTGVLPDAGGSWPGSPTGATTVGSEGGESEASWPQPQAVNAARRIRNENGARSVRSEPRWTPIRN